MHSQVLVRCTGFIGDILFASSIAKKLVEETEVEGNSVDVDYYIPLPQPMILLTMNPYIRHVYKEFTFDPTIYDKIVDIPTVNQALPATIQFQQVAGVKNPSTEFNVWTVDTYDTEMEKMVAEIRSTAPEKPVVAWQSNWYEKTLRFTEAQYTARTEHGHRTIEDILSVIEPHVTLLEVGLPVGVTQHDARSQDPYLYAMTASAIKACDWMIGGEGGLTNLACAVGTKTIITTDWFWKQYGPLGNYARLDMPAMGPKTYYPNAGHVHLDPYLTDTQVGESIVMLTR